MNLLMEGLEPEYTVTNAQHRLTAERPVKIITCADDDVPEERICGMRESRAGRAVIPPHDHEYYELTVWLAGTGFHETVRGRSPVERGTVFALAPGEVHGFQRTDDGPVCAVICTYLAEWLFPDVRGLLDDMGFISLFLHRALFGSSRRIEIPQWNVEEETLKACIGEFRDIAQECEREELSHSFLRSCLRKAMIRLFRAYKDCASTPQLLTVEPVVRAALLHIEDCILECTPFRVGALAEERQMTPDSFSKCFKEATGSSPMDYYQHRRLQQACTMLLGTNDAITEIAYTLGYCDAAHFSHLFKRYRGMKPSEYRGKHRV
jgi:AraC-like DNA-binding protein